MCVLFSFQCHRKKRSLRYVQKCIEINRETRFSDGLGEGGDRFMHELVRFILNEEDERQMHWSSNLKLLLVLRGECIYSFQGECVPMKTGSLWAVNPFCLYQILRGFEADVLTISFSEEAMEGMKLAREQEIFCRSDLQEENDKEGFVIKSCSEVGVSDHNLERLSCILTLSSKNSPSSKVAG